MCSKNQKVGHLICPIHNNVFGAQRIFRVLQNSLFRTNDLYSKNKTEQDLCKERTCSVFYRKTIWRRGCLPWNSISFLNDFKAEIMRNDGFGICWETSFPVPAIDRSARDTVEKVGAVWLRPEFPGLSSVSMDNAMEWYDNPKADYKIMFHVVRSHSGAFIGQYSYTDKRCFLTGNANSALYNRGNRVILKRMS